MEQIIQDSKTGGNTVKDMEVVSFANGQNGKQTPYPERNKDGEPFGGFALIINGHSLVRDRSTYFADSITIGQ